MTAETENVSILDGGIERSNAYAFASWPRVLQLEYNMPDRALHYNNERKLRGIASRFEKKEEKEKRNLNRIDLVASFIVV